MLLSHTWSQGNHACWRRNHRPQPPPCQNRQEYHQFQETSSIGGVRGKYREGSKASTHRLPRYQARCNHTRFDHHWSFPGSFLDRGRSKKVLGKLNKASAYIAFSCVVVDLTLVKRDISAGDVNSSSVLRMGACFGSVLGSFFDRGRSRKVRRRFNKASTYQSLTRHQARCNHARFDHQVVSSW